MTKYFTILVSSCFWIVIDIDVLTKLLFRRLTAFGDNTPGISVSVLIIPRSVPERRNAIDGTNFRKRVEAVKFKLSKGLNNLCQMHWVINEYQEKK